MTDALWVLFPPADQPLARVPEQHVVRRKEDLERRYRARSARRFVAFESVQLVDVVARLHTWRPHRLLLLEAGTPHEGRLSALRACFKTVVRPAPSPRGLRPGALFEALTSPRAQDLALAVTHDPEARAVYVLRGNLETATFPESALRGFGERAPPDLSTLRVEDGGQTLQAGEFEAAVDALLYEHDADFRRRLKKQRRDAEQSLGASIRRLRLQRGLRQADFDGVTAKEVARIERGEVTNPRHHTLHAIALRLGVPIDELRDY